MHSPRCCSGWDARLPGAAVACDAACCDTAAQSPPQLSAAIQLEDNLSPKVPGQEATSTCTLLSEPCMALPCPRWPQGLCASSCRRQMPYPSQDPIAQCIPTCQGRATDDADGRDTGGVGAAPSLRCGALRTSVMEVDVELLLCHRARRLAGCSIGLEHSGVLLCKACTLSLQHACQKC